MKKTIFLTVTAILILLSFNVNAQVKSLNEIRIPYTRLDITDRTTIFSFKENQVLSYKNFLANKELRVKGNLFVDNGATFLGHGKFSSIETGTIETGTFSSETTASFDVHIDSNDTDSYNDTFKVFQGKSKKNILDVGINYFKVKSGQTNIDSNEFSSSQAGSFVVNVDNNSNSKIDKFKVLYGSAKKEILTAGEDDVTISTKLITTKNIETKDIAANNIKAKDIVANKVVLKVGSFPDYVFANDYTLMPLKEVATYIKNNKRLPNMPSEKEVVKKGMDLKELTIKLVEKIEELTLHTIKQQERIENLEKKLNNIKN